MKWICYLYYVLYARGILRKYDSYEPDRNDEPQRISKSDHKITNANLS